jgi:hypothetical protein
MRFKIKFEDQWHRWFAWYPVRIGDERVWLEFVERRITEGGLFDDSFWYRWPK